MIEHRKIASIIIISVKSNAIADEIVAKGITLVGRRLSVERYINARPDTICNICAR